MSYFKIFAFQLTVLALLLPASWAVDMKSPGGGVSASVFVTGDGDLNYSIAYKGADVVEPSALGISVDSVDLGKGVQLGSPEASSVDQTYQTRGKHSVARDRHNAWRFPVVHRESGRTYSIEFRLYDDGVAYRYIVPGKGIQHVDGESSSWKIVRDAKTWFFERDNGTWKLKSYAGEWISADISQMEGISPGGPIQGTPLVFKLPKNLGYAAVTKAALYDYSGMRLKSVGDRTFVADFTEGDEGFNVEGAIVTPWRVTMLVENLNELVNSDLINNLNPAPDTKRFADTSYIKPGRSVWSWEPLGLGDPALQKKFIEYAAKLGFEYSIVDDGWKDWDSPWETMKALCDHGRRKGVGVWLWVDSKDIRDPSDHYRQMRDYFDRVAAAGSVGLKIDFMNAESKDRVDFEIAVLRFAADRKLLINFHGCHASTGEERTYPNELTREGIRGIEVNKMKEGPLPASHNAALPFTRFVVGQADYTPILYTNPGPTTYAHQLATLIAFTSPLQVFAEHPATMMNAPVLKDAIPVVKAIPTVWDETIALPGSEIGELAAFARRSGTNWFIGILNGGRERDYKVDLSFLPMGRYIATLVRDDLKAEVVDVAKLGINKKADQKQWTTAIPFAVSDDLIDRSQTLSIDLAGGGGFVAMLVRK